MGKEGFYILICAFFISAGSDVVSMRCKADRVDGGYVLNGNKMWCTNGPTAQTLVFAPIPLSTRIIKPFIMIEGVFISFYGIVI